MSRPAKGPSLWLRPEKRNADGTLRERAVWDIRDGSRKISTGCAAQDREGAERALGDYLASKYKPNRGRKRHPDEILIADVLTIYLTDVAPDRARENEIKQRILALDAYWQDKTLAEVNGANCRGYVKYRTSQQWKSCRPGKTGKPPRMVSEAAARRELEDLRAAINHHRQEGLCSEIVAVTLPEKPLPRDIWLTRFEAALLLRTMWRARQVMRDKNTLRDVGKHVARYSLVGLFTGTRSAAICGAALTPAVGRGYVDLDAGVFHRKAIGRLETKKRQPPVKLERGLLAHMRRWRDRGISKVAVVEWNGKPIAKVRRAFAAAVKASGLNAIVSARLGYDVKVTPHVLRHTAATWLMQAGVDLWEAAGFLGMTVKQLEDTYGHHHPDFQEKAATALRGRKASTALRGQYAARNPVNKMRVAATNGPKIEGFSR
jgi:integrase